MLKSINLFAGIGGIRLGFDRAFGNLIKTVFVSEWDKYAHKTYRANFHDDFEIAEDITKISVDDIPEFDILIAGFPCQTFSVCGKQKGFADKRGNVFFKIGKTIDAKQPQIVFLENVANLPDHGHGKTFNVIHNELAGCGYYIRYTVADACEYGIPQHRTRSYIVAFRDKQACDDFRFPEKVPLEKRITDVIDTTVKADDGYYLKPDTPAYERLKKAITDDKQLYRFADFGIQASKDGIAFTLKANMGTYPNRVPIIKDDYGIRTITPRKCLALQGFPEIYTFPNTVPKLEQYKQADNTVCASVISDIIKFIL